MLNISVWMGKSVMLSDLVRLINNFLNFDISMASILCLVYLYILEMFLEELSGVVLGS